MTYRLHIVLDLSKIVGERRLSCALMKLLNQIDDFRISTPLWRSRVAELCKSGGEIGFVKKPLTHDLLPGEKVIIVTDFSVIYHWRCSGLGCVLMMVQPPPTSPTQGLPSTSRIKVNTPSLVVILDGH